MADPFNPMRWGLPPGVGPQAARMPPQAQAQAPGILPTFARPPGMMQSPSPQADRLSQAFQPPVQPTFTDPSRSMAPPGVGDFGGSQGNGPQSPLLKPKGPIMPKTTPQGPIGEGGTQDAQSGSSIGNGPSGGPDTSNGNPWINPAQLAAMDGSGGKKPGEGLLSFMNSGAPTAFQNPQQGPNPDGSVFQGENKGLFGGGIGEKGSPISMLTGGSDMDPSSALSGILKLFGGFGGFGR
jgi:hypothetical protein